VTIIFYTLFKAVIASLPVIQQYSHQQSSWSFLLDLINIEAARDLNTL